MIRQEQPTDYETIYEVIKTAFETAAVKDGDEQDYVSHLRKSSKYIPELALVAEKDGHIVGHIMLTKMVINGKEQTFDALLLSPLCVAYAYRNRGIGGKLIEKSFKLAREKGYSSVFLCGNPEYYSHFGFKETCAFGIINESNVPQKYIMACELFPGALKGKEGKIHIV
ncbi:GNAT family N-acetyltransferase [Sporanaerobium hydrogeniformans]|uniref:GNAT family N-acetyltransferase n=1 Tax=Sporanaerobium hydrogeniformans TaxID=3072179 RepID=A0AC61DHQ0_9FIRM|nr:N-acetyltransferase [Sporanaerobium hydrogeniformans]PHV71792.1 GNAT family N-acetyltransferase [Sporanaerobium hydrogeniformans]